jgi:hypothetical protein
LIGIYIPLINWLIGITFADKLREFLVRDHTTMLFPFVKFLVFAIIVAICQYLIHQTIKIILYRLVIRFSPHKIQESLAISKPYIRSSNIFEAFPRHVMQIETLYLYIGWGLIWKWYDTIQQPQNLAFAPAFFFIWSALKALQDDYLRD